jgi:hypothetical protein
MYEYKETTTRRDFPDREFLIWGGRYRVRLCGAPVLGHIIILKNTGRWSDGLPGRARSGSHDVIVALLREEETCSPSHPAR